MGYIKRLSFIPYIFTVFICFFILLPFGVYVFQRDYSLFSENIASTVGEVEDLLEWTIKQDRQLIKGFFNSTKKSIRADVYEKMELNLSNINELADKFFLKETTYNFKTIIESLSLKYPVYLKSQKGLVIGASKGMPPLKIPIENDAKGPFNITDSNGNNWIVIEKKIQKGLYKIGTVAKDEDINASIREVIIESVLNSEIPTLGIFLMDRDGRFLANESEVFPGRLISDEQQQKKSDELVLSILDIKNVDIGKFIDFTWKIPEINIDKIQKKKIFVKYDEELDWIVGIAVTIDGLYDYHEFELFKLRKVFKEEFINYCIFLMILFVTLVMGGIYIGRKMTVSFKTFQGFIEKANTTDEPIDCSELSFEEFKNLGKVANEVVEDRKRQKNVITAYMNKLRAVNKMLKDKSDRDGLTGIHNRGYFDEALKKVWQDAIRNNKPVSVGMIDIDFFKQYNDNYGHQKGDECLIMVAKTISSALKRPYDFVARYGGEEFVVLLPNTDSKGAMTLAMIIEKSIAEKNIEHKASAVSFRVTFSMGISTVVPQQELAPEIIVKKADEALYEAKKNGRNQIVLA